MREIKFKAKRVDNNEWIYGDLVQNKVFIDGECFIVEPNKFNEDRTYDSYYKEARHITIKPETVCQFIDIQDKNGKDIYENDKLDIEDGLNSFTAIVVYKTGRFITRCLCGCKADFTYFSVPNKAKYMNMKLIGNKFDGD